MRYEVKPESIEAVLFDGSNVDEVVDLLGKHLVKVTGEPMPPHDDTVSVFDIATKTWVRLNDGFYVVLLEDGSVLTIRKDAFEAKYQPAKPVDFGKWNPQPTPMPYWPDRIGDPYPTLPRPIVTYESNTEGRPHVTV